MRFDLFSVIFIGWGNFSTVEGFLHDSRSDRDELGIYRLLNRSGTMPAAPRLATLAEAGTVGFSLHGETRFARLA